MSVKVNTLLLAANIIGVAVYLIASSYSWALPQERALNATTGEPFVWAVGVLPIWLVFLLINLTWGGFIVARKHWCSGRFWLVTVGIWVISVAVDFAHH